MKKYLKEFNWLRFVTIIGAIVGATVFLTTSPGYFALSIAIFLVTILTIVILLRIVYVCAGPELKKHMDNKLAIFLDQQ